MIKRYGCESCGFIIDVDDDKVRDPWHQALASHKNFVKHPGVERYCNLIHLSDISKVLYVAGTEQGDETIDSQVDHPVHYRSHPSNVEPITICRHCNFNIGNAIKYIMRADHKGDAVQDLNKARWYLADEIERLGGKVEERT